MTEQQTNDPISVNPGLLAEWAMDDRSAVALHLKQVLVPVEAVEGKDDKKHEGIVFPPTYADIGYNIDTLSDGTRVATIDSVGSQANRLEPLFKHDGPLARLVPQINIKINDGSRVSIFDLPHRAADATVQSSPGLAELAAKAFQDLKQGNATTLCELAPTSLLFGVWDSRGGTGEKRPRLVRSLIRAWNVEVLHAAAQFNSVWKKLDGKQRAELEREAKQKKVDLSAKGLADAPATFRKIKENKIPLYSNGAPNPDARVLGGVLVKGRIQREVTINLVALRGLRGDDTGANKATTGHVRRYLLGLALLAATTEMDLFLREGCLLRYASDQDVWYAIPRRGDPQQVALSNVHATILNFTEQALAPFSDRWQQLFKENRTEEAGEDSRLVAEYEFDTNKAKKLLATKTEEEEAAAGTQ